MHITKKQSTTFWQKIKPLYAGFMHFCAPSSCAVCRAVVSESDGMGICASCFNNMPKWDMDQVPSPKLPKHVDGFDAPFLYEEDIAMLIKGMKFGDKPEYSAALASLMYGKFMEVYRSDILVLPVPMHKKRLQKRMFNQSALLVKELAKKAPFLYSLTGFNRQRETKPQVGQSALSRQKNLKGAFEVLMDVADQSILLIDDVWTTGSTAEACAKCLKEAGAKEVRVLTVAYVDKPSDI